MAASEAQIRANQANSAQSSGPKTPEGKERSRANSYKHGMTGAGIVLPEADAIELSRRADAFIAELNADGEVQYALARRAALNSMRMERGADQQTSALAEHIRRVQAEFEAPEGLNEAQVAQIRERTVRRAMFDSSKEAVLARKYEAAAERGFYRALKELRVIQKPAKALNPAAKEEVFRQELASILKQTAGDAEFEAMLKSMDARDALLTDPTPRRGGSVPNSPRSPAERDSFDLPFAVGKAR
jgi:hypothetical protein